MEQRTYIARHSANVYAAGACERRAYRFQAEFVIEVKCPDCGRRMSKVDLIEGTVREDRECNPRCVGATTGGVCECKCGGENHGGAWN